MTRDTNFKHLEELRKNIGVKAKKAMIINHRKMDGDALGSAYAFGKVLEKKGKEVRYFSQDLPSSDFDFLDLDIQFETNVPKDYKPDIILCFDTAGAEQLGSIYSDNKKLFEETTVFVFDHHPSNPDFGDYNIIFPDKSSTCEIVYDLMFNHNYEKYMDEKIATAMLMGIITDTNSFFNTNSSPRAMEVAGLLMGYGARHQDIILNLFKKKPFNRLKLWGKLLESIKQSEDGKYIWTTITNDLFLSTNTTINDTSGFIDEFLSSISGAKIVFLLYELGGGKVKGSFRSKDDNYDVAEFCKLFGGGGHSRAAGFTAEKISIYELEIKVLEKLKIFF